MYPFLITLGFIPILSTELSDRGSRSGVIIALADQMDLNLTKPGPIKHATELQTPSIRAKALVKPTLGGMVADQIGLGKTIPTLYLLSGMTKYYISEKDSKSALVVCPPMLIESWAKEANTKFPEMSIGIIYADTNKTVNPELVIWKISAEFTNQLPSMPHALAAAVEDVKKRNTEVIIASTDTSMTRIVKEMLDEAKGRVVTERMDEVDGIMKKCILRLVTCGHKMKKMFSITPGDEEHRMSLKSTIYFSIRRITAKALLENLRNTNDIIRELPMD